ncbi:SAST-like protein [Mya arenaria]|uniref:oleoyl-[acyl-carrier-protein] hydrolase n=1 Tax=Mya arenaria TaxID=6604 RepID=A0ABY7DPG9_MYAAR|nr:SAST-like protein [Mya arenaria]
MSDKVLNCLLRRPQAKWKLFCFPWAGGGAVFYANWGRNMSEDVEVHGVCLAGRESRYNEPVSSDVGHYGRLSSFSDSKPYEERARSRAKSFVCVRDIRSVCKYIYTRGTPSEILDNKEYISIFLPALKADFELLYNISAENSDPMPVLSSSIHVFDGSDDAPHDLQAWRSVSSGEFDLTILKGGHFYLKDTECSIKLQQCILQKLSLTS